MTRRTSSVGTGGTIIVLAALALFWLHVDSARGSANQVAVVWIPSSTTQRQLTMIDPASAAKTGPYLLTRFGYGGATASPDGNTIAYVGSTDGTAFPLYMQDTIGGAPNLAFANCDAPAWAPNGAQLACWERNGSGPSQTYTLVVVNTDGGGRHPVYGPVTFAAGGEPLAWWPDGSRIVTTDRSSVFSVPAGGGGTTTLVPGTTDSIFSASVSPDGASLAFVRQTATGGGDYSSKLVIRTIVGGNEHPIVQESPPEHLIGFGSPPQWSPDGNRIVFMESTYGSMISSSGRVAIVDASSGANRKELMSVGEGSQINSIAWGNGTQPSYFIKHVELAQGVSPDVVPLAPVDPLSATPLELPWTEPSLGGFPIPLVAGRSTLMRIYIGDASLAPGLTATREVAYRITGPATPLEGKGVVAVTAPDVAPNQQALESAIDVWLPAGEAIAGGRQFAVSVNPDLTETECAGCFPNGNTANVTGVQFRNGGNVSIRPTAVTLIEKSGKVPPSPRYTTGFFTDLARWLPVSDDGIVMLPNGPPLEIDVRGRSKTVDYCDYVGPVVDMVFLAAGGGPFSKTGPAIPVAYASPVLQGVACGGSTNPKTQRIVLLSPDIGDLAHEVGHAVGLDHTVAAGPGALVAAGEVALPYPGIGGWGYERNGASTLIHDKTSTGDLMSYSVNRWLSPFSWNGIYKGILAEAPNVAPHVPRSIRAVSHSAKVQARRLVAGVLVGGRGQIITSLTTDAAAPDSTGPVAGRLVALDRRGRKLTSVAIHGAAVDETPGAGHDAVPFVAALSAKLKVAKLIMRNAKGKTAATLSASKRRPSARFLVLPRKASASKKLTIHWTSADRDSRSLTALLYARRGSGAWQLLAMTTGGRKSAPTDPARLGKGKALRLRLTVSDGFTTTTKRSRAIRLR
jgi:hypothetical protein